MATTHISWWGVELELSDAEVSQVVTAMTTGGNVINGLAHLVGSFFTHLAHAHALAPAGTILKALAGLGASALTNCNANKNGVTLYAKWVGGFWCDPR